MPTKRSRELRPLSSEHHQALLVAFQLKKAIAGHAESAGAPKDLDGLAALVRRFEDSVLLVHLAVEEEVLGKHLAPADVRRLRDEHRQLRDLLVEARSTRQAARRAPLLAFADLLERPVRWEERELFAGLEASLPREDLVRVGDEMERRLVTSAKAARKPVG